MTDLRIEEHYQAWIARRNLEQLVRRVLLWQNTPSIGPHAQALRHALFSPPSPEEVAEFDQVLRTMGVPWTWVSPTLLGTSFPCRFVNDAHPENPPLALQGDVEMVSTARKGRQPTAEALAGLERQVGWWYAHKIKHPRDSIPELERRERERLGVQWASSRHSTVIQGIQRVEALLGVWDRVEVGPQKASVDMEIAN